MREETKRERTLLRLCLICDATSCGHAQIVLYDQITRNIFRGTARAYRYDPRARALVQPLLPPAVEFDTLPFCYKLTCCICLVHSENLTDHALIADHLLPNIRRDARCDPSLLDTLLGVCANHRDRVQLFGRIPERNKYLGPGRGGLHGGCQNQNRIIPRVG